jgi:uncharacterized membrane protein
MYDLPTQVTLGVFLSTGLYCLLLLRIVEHHDGGAAAPHLSVLVAVMFSVLSMAMLIVFIHHVAMLIQAPHVVAAVARDLDDAIARLFPEEIGDAVGDEQRRNERGRDQEAGLGEEYLVVRSTGDGYIQAIDEDGLMQMACERDLVLRLRSRPGNFIATGSPLADVWAGCDLSCALFPLPTHWTPLSTRSASTVTTASRSRSVCWKPLLWSPNTFNASKTAML